MVDEDRSAPSAPHDFVNSFTHPLGRAPGFVLRCRHHSKLKGVLGEGNVAHTAMSGDGTTAGDDPLQTAVWRLRSRACWVDAAALIEPDGPRASLQRTALLVERCLYTEQGWEDAEDALRTAEAQARTDDERGAAACERGQLAYAATLLDTVDPAAGRAAWERLRDDDGEFTTFSGCLMDRATLRTYATERLAGTTP